MSDRRFLFANARVADAALEGRVEAGAFSRPEGMRCMRPLVDLCRAPAGARDKQLLLGQPLELLERHDRWAFVRDAVDGYVGYVQEDAVGEGPSPTHRVGVRSGHVYAEPDIKAPETGSLSFFAEVATAEAEGGFHALVGGGYMPAQQLVPLSWRAEDAVHVAEMFLGTPYLWGGNSGFGIDCSGLVQMALYAAGRASPRDSDVQEAELGRALEAGEPLQRGDLVFWRGHVGMMRDAQTLIHANAHHMAVASEPFVEAVQRIGQREFGQVTAIKRIGDMR